MRSRASKPKLWDVVAQCRETGQLEALRDGRLKDGIPKAVEQEVESRSSYTKVKKKKKAVREERGEGYGGENEEGFFSK